MISVKVRRAELHEAEKLNKFYFQAYGHNAQYKFPERWNWHFKDNPFKDRDKLPVYIAENSNGDIVGHTAACRVRCKIFEKSVDLGWSVDTIVLPELRGMGTGKLLQKFNQDDHTLFASLSMTDANKHIKLKQGAVEGPYSRLYIRMLSFEKTFTSKIILLVQNSKKRKESSPLFGISEPEPANFSVADTALWTKIRERFDIAVERDATYLNWRYKEQPLTKHFCCRAFDKNGDYCGLIVYRITEENNPKGAVILELMGIETKEVLYWSLLNAVEKHVLSLGATQLQIAVSDSNIEKAVLTGGYFKIDEKPLIIHGPEKLIDQLTTKSVAMLTKGDQDWDEFPRANVFSHYGLIKWSKDNYNLKNIKNIAYRYVLNLYMFSLRLRFRQ